MLKTTLLCFLWTCGLLPTAISLLFVVAMAGKPTRCDRPGCTARTYGWELLVLPIATTSPLVSGYFIAQTSSNKKQQDLKSDGKPYEA